MLSWEQSSQCYKYKFYEEHSQLSTKNKPYHNMCVCGVWFIEWCILFIGKVYITLRIPY